MDAPSRKKACHKKMHGTRGRASDASGKRG